MPSRTILLFCHVVLLATGICPVSTAGLAVERADGCFQARTPHITASVDLRTGMIALSGPEGRPVLQGTTTWTLASGQPIFPAGYPNHGLSERVRYSAAGETRDFTIRHSGHRSLPDLRQQLTISEEGTAFFLGASLAAGENRRPPVHVEGSNVLQFDMTGGREHWFSPLSDHVLMMRQGTRMPSDRRVPVMLEHERFPDSYDWGYYNRWMRRETPRELDYISESFTALLHTRTNRRFFLGFVTQHDLFDFWRQRYHGTFEDLVKLELPPGDALLLSVRAAAGHPQVLASDMHYTQGAAEFSEVRWDHARQTLLCVSDFDHQRDVNMVVYVPPGFDVKGVSSADVEGLHWKLDGEVLTAGYTRGSRPTRLLVQFGRSPAPAGFAGRWNLTVFDRDRPRAWWLEVRDGGEGAFVGAPNGQVNPLKEMSVHDGELRFRLRDGWSRSGAPADGLFRARLVNGHLEGVFSVAGESELHWVGRRAPAATEKDDGSRREAGPRPLFNGRDFSGWETRSSPVVFRPLAAPPPGSEASGWRIQDGLLSTGGCGVPLVTCERFRDFALHVEFRVAPGGNSGIGLRGRYEVQIIDDYGRPVTGHTTGGVYGRLRPSMNAARPAGEWQSYDIRLVGRQVTVTLNGARVIDKGEIEGPTAIAIDSEETEPGPICLQGDHGAVDFRNIVLTPLVPPGAP